MQCQSDQQEGKHLRSGSPVSILYAQVHQAIPKIRLSHLGICSSLHAMEKPAFLKHYLAVLVR